jgi:hypothetical protein
LIFKTGVVTKDGTRQRFDSSKETMELLFDSDQPVHSLRPAKVSKVRDKYSTFIEGIYRQDGNYYSV